MIVGRGKKNTKGDGKIDRDSERKRGRGGGEERCDKREMFASTHNQYSMTGREKEGSQCCNNKTGSGD